MKTARRIAFGRGAGSKALFTIAMLLAPSVARADETVYGLSIAIARDGKERVVDDVWMQDQIAQANSFFVPLAVRFRWTHEKDLPEPHGELHSRADRDALARYAERSVIDVFVVRTLEDVDTPGILRMGVCWQGPGRRYVVVAQSARPTVLAHELGHFFGNHEHSKTKNNLMSYDRDGGTVFLDDGQKAVIRSVSAQYLTSGLLVDVGPPRLLF